MDSEPDYEDQQPSTGLRNNNLQLPRLRASSLSQYTQNSNVPLSGDLREP